MESRNATPVSLQGSLEPMLEPWAPVAGEIVAEGLWCVLESCWDVAAQRWEPELLICSDDEGEIEAEVAAWAADHPALDLRVSGYTRDALHRAGWAPQALCHLAPAI